MENIKDGVASDNTQKEKIGGGAPKKSKKVTNTKPANYKETEQLAKKLLNAEGKNYFEWLDALHKEIIFEKMLENQDSIISAIED